MRQILAATRTRRALLILALVLLAIPATVFADESKLHGGWNLVAIQVSGQRVDVSAQLNANVAFDKAKKTWTVRLDQDGKTNEATGQYRLEGDQLYLSFQGQTAPAVTIAFVNDELQVTFAVEQKPNAERYTIIAKRGEFKPRPKAPPKQPAPPPPPPS